MVTFKLGEEMRKLWCDQQVMSMGQRKNQSPRSTNSIFLASHVRKDFSYTERELLQVEAFPIRTVGGPLVSEAPAQDNYITEYCI